MQTKTKGLIIREQTVGESDKLVTVITEDFGLIKAFVRRAKTIKSQNLSCLFFRLGGTADAGYAQIAFKCFVPFVPR